MMLNCVVLSELGMTARPSVLFKWFTVITFIQIWMPSVSANFNLFLDRREFQKLHGISSDIYYVLEGVVNEYALNFLVTVPPEVDDLHFSWQALTKRAVHYDMTMEYTDFYALLPPVSNITNSGRVPHTLQTFKVSLLCSGRSNAEVGFTIKMNFQVRHPKLNTTSINIKRNKICLFKETPPEPKLPELPPPPPIPPVGLETSPNSSPHFPTANNSTTLFFQDPTPTLLLAGLLGGCAVTASVVFLIFFICLKRKLTPSSNLQPHHSYNDPNSSNNSSPACLLRQAQVPDTANQLWNHEKSSQALKGTISSRSGSQNSYVTIASFWNDIFSTGSNTSRQVQTHAHTHTHTTAKFPVPISTAHKVQNSFSAKNSDRGSDVSPYAYAHIVPVKQPKNGPPSPKIGAPPPSLIEWYSQSPCQSQNQNVHVNADGNNPPEYNYDYKYTHDMSTFNPKLIFSPKIVSVAPEPVTASSSSSSSSSPSSSASSTEPEPHQRQKKSPIVRSDCDRVVVQIDGFQCRKDFDKETNVVERFL